MGLSSSQARLLNLTARMHQIEYKAARLEAMKLQMANESTRVYEDYLDAMDKTKIQVKNLKTDGSITYEDVASYSKFIEKGYALVVHGATTTVCTDQTSLVNAVKGVYGSDLDIADGLTNHFTETLTNLINSGIITIVQGSTTQPPGTLNTDFTKSGNFYFPKKTNTNFFKDCETSVSTNTGLQEVTDEVNLRKAEAKYEADMKRIDLKDRKYDTDLAALDTERNAIKQEMETLKTVAKDNVERTFKLFS